MHTDDHYLNTKVGSIETVLLQRALIVFN